MSILGAAIGTLVVATADGISGGQTYKVGDRGRVIANDPTPVVQTDGGRWLGHVWFANWDIVETEGGE